MRQVLIFTPIIQNRLTNCGTDQACLLPAVNQVSKVSTVATVMCYCDYVKY